MARAPSFLVAVPALLGCGSWDAPDPPADETCELGERSDSDYPTGLHVVGNHIEDAEGNVVTLRGVNRMGTEYKCLQEDGFFEGPLDADVVRAMTTWNINAVRVPLNEACWLGINGAPEGHSGCSYKQAIVSYVELLHDHALIPILDLHWTAPSELPADRLQPMPSADHAAPFWRDVARTFRGDTGVVLEPFNEPFPGDNSDSDQAWQCWRDGCDVYIASRTGETAGTYPAVGMQALVSAIREVGAENLILLGGVQYSNALSQWLAHRPDDPLENLAAAWHVYNTNPCSSLECWSGAPAELAATVPIVATELGQNDCEATMVTPLLEFLDQYGAGYLAWSWTAFGPCVPPMPGMRARPWSLITDYYAPTPNSAYAAAFQEHLLSF